MLCGMNHGQISVWCLTIARLTARTQLRRLLGRTRGPADLTIHLTTGPIGRYKLKPYLDATASIPGSEMSQTGLRPWFHSYANPPLSHKPTWGSTSASSTEAGTLVELICELRGCMYKYCETPCMSFFLHFTCWARTVPGLFQVKAKLSKTIGREMPR
jgi:hypothetical protein